MVIFSVEKNIWNISKNPELNLENARFDTEDVQFDFIRIKHE